MEIVGDEYGLTRERVRQIEDRFLHTLRKSFVALDTPLLDQLIAAYKQAEGLDLATFEQTHSELRGESMETIIYVARSLKASQFLPDIQYPLVHDREVAIVGDEADALSARAVGIASKRLHKFAGHELQSNA